MANQKEGMDYNQWMLDCLVQCSWNRRQGIALFIQSVIQWDPKKASWITPYAYKVYDRVASESVSPMQKLITEHAHHLRAASEATLQRGLQQGDWTAFNSIANTIIRATGLDKKDVNVHLGGQHVHMSRPPEEVQNRINELSATIARGLSTSVGGIQLPVADKPIVDIQTTPETTAYPAV